jgi:hypothetical protein
MTKRLKLAVLLGGILGVFCIIGGASRLGWQGNQLMLFALWYNRLVMGFMIGLAGNWILIPGKWNWVFRGGGLGLLVSAAYFFSSGVSDWVSFLAGIVYGLIIEAVVRRYTA